MPIKTTKAELLRFYEDTLVWGDEDIYIEEMAIIVNGKAIENDFTPDDLADNDDVTLDYGYLIPQGSTSYLVGEDGADLLKVFRAWRKKRN